MTTVAENVGSAHVRWLFAGAFSPLVNGKVIKISRNNYTECLSEAITDVVVEVRDRLGADDIRKFSLRCDGLATFKLANVVDRISMLKELQILAQNLVSTDPNKRPSANQAVATVIELIGEGRLAQELDKALTPPPAKESTAATSNTAVSSEPEATISKSDSKSSSSPSSAAGGDNVLDRIFAQVKSKQATKDAAANAVGSFVSALRQTDATTSSNKSSYSLNSTPGRNGRNIIEDAIYATAADILRSPTLNALEAVWRGVKLVIDETPRENDLEITLFDTPTPCTATAIESALATDRAEWPDAVFILDPIPDIEAVEALAELMASISIPVVTTVADEVFAVALSASGMRKPEDVIKALGPEWARFRSNELSRWVCACANQVVVHEEGQGPTRRKVLASPVFAAAAMLTASYRDTGLFGRVFGPTGSIKTPATHTLREGNFEAMLPVNRFVPTTMQADLAAGGVLALGSPKNSDKVIASSWPTMSASPDAVGLPAQIITGRVVRFALWVRDQIPPGSAESDIKEIFEQAAGVFLFPGISEGAFLDAQVLPDQNGAPRVVHLNVEVRAALAGTSVHLGFDVPLN